MSDAVALGVAVSVRVGVHVGGSVGFSGIGEASSLVGNSATVGNISISGSLDVPQAVIINKLTNKLAIKK